jgi:hypothetical protein
MKGSMLYLLFSALIFSRVISGAFSQVEKQQSLPDELFI